MDVFTMDLVVPIHGGLPLNRIFFESLRANTRHPFRLIVVDNHSPDASGEYFRSQKGSHFEVVVLSNDRNQCYPVSMNQGLRLSTSSIVGLLNNDIVFGPGWDVELVTAIEKGETELASPMGLEHMPYKPLEDVMFRRWRMILKKTYSADEETDLREKIRVMYGNFESFAGDIQERYRGVSYPGLMGHCHLISRRFLSLIGELDPRMQGADWDLYLRAAKMKEDGIVSTLPLIFGGSFVHHFIRATQRKKNLEPVTCTHAPHLSVEEKWEGDEIGRLWPYPEQRPGYRKTFRDRMSRWHSKFRAWKSLTNGKDLIQFLKEARLV